ncbi:AraC family transcriptional regulator [Proteobacteria bacterium 005FR1]|nr:AraC family transcriptional regulator [Proteobacteria bacterium 005FR1]
MHPVQYQDPTWQTAAAAELLHLGFQRFSPHPALRPWVQCYWSVSRPHLEQDYVEWLYPDGGASLTFDFTTDTPRTFLSASQSLYSKRFGGHVDSLGIRFHPGGAAFLLDLPIGEMREFVYCMQDLGFADLRSVSGQLKESSLQQRLAGLDRWLTGRLARLRSRHDPVAQLWPMLARACDLSSAVYDLGFSRRTAERLFRERVGISPHQLKLMLRAKRARQLIKSLPQATLTDIAQDCGYFDQAHFIRHFRQYTGSTPGQYRQRQLERLARGELAFGV